MQLKPIGFHLLLEKVDHQEKEGKLITQALPVFKLHEIGINALDAFPAGVKTEQVYIKPGSEGDPIRKEGRYFYFVHIDYVIGYE